MPGITDNNEDLDDLIENEAEMLACRLRPLFQRDTFNYLEKEGLVKMNSFDRPAMVIWPQVYANLRYDGWTQNEAIAWLQSKGLKWFLDACENSLFDAVSKEISDGADKKFLEDPVEITYWPDTTEIEKPDIFISRTEKEGVKVYSNHPELIGDIQVFEPLTSDEVATEMSLYRTDPDKLKGDAIKWQSSLETGKVDLKTFLEKFIISNT